MDLKKTLKKQYPYKTELHAHTTPASPCSQITPEEMVETYRKNCYDAVVITNHFALDLFKGAPKKEAIDKYLSDYEITYEEGKRNGIKVYLGAEVRFAENSNDYLIYGADRAVLETVYDYLDKGLEAFRKEVKLSKSVFIQAHPSRDRMTKVSPLLLDGMEVFNMHPGHASRNAITGKIVRDNPHLISTAGSDFHHPGLGHEAISALRTSELPEDSFGIASILKSRDYLLEIAGNSIILP